jgi:hypothetical protein
MYLLCHYSAVAEDISFILFKSTFPLIYVRNIAGYNFSNNQSEIWKNAKMCPESWNENQIMIQNNNAVIRLVKWIE